MTRGHDRTLDKSGEALRRTGWLDTANYKFAHRLTRRDWAWEFLRRNKNYVTDWKFSRKEAATASQDNRFTMFRLVSDASRMQRWGLIFRGRTGKEGWRS